MEWYNNISWLSHCKWCNYKWLLFVPCCVSISQELTFKEFEMAKRSPVENQNKGRFASFVLPIVSVQRFYRNSSRRTRDTWLEKYTYRTVDEAEDSTECLRRSSTSPPSLAPDKPTDLQHHEGNNKVMRYYIWLYSLTTTIPKVKNAHVSQNVY